MSSSYPKDVVKKWSKMRDDFDQDSSKPNPYQESEERTDFSVLFTHLLRRSLDFTMAKLRLGLLKGEQMSASASSERPPCVSPAIFFQKAIETEDRL